MAEALEADRAMRDLRERYDNVKAIVESYKKVREEGWRPKAGPGDKAGQEDKAGHRVQAMSAVRRMQTVS